MGIAVTPQAAAPPRPSLATVFAFEEIQSRAHRPFRGVDQPPSPRFRQALWTDTVYVRGLFQLDRLDADDLRRLFLILHVAYGATDLCTRILKHLDARTGDTAAVGYRAEGLATYRLPRAEIQSAGHGHGSPSHFPDEPRQLTDPLTLIRSVRLRLLEEAGQLGHRIELLVPDLVEDSGR